MSQIFVSNDAEFRVERLDAGAYHLDAASPGAPPRLVATEPEGQTAKSNLLVLARSERGSGHAADRWLLLVAPGQRAFRNGEPIALGIAVLRHRDELRLGDGAPFYFSDERLAAVETYAADDAARCPRCAQAIAREERVVRCPGPGCGAVHHERLDLNCWTYLDRCARCEQPTELEAGLRWSPEGI